MRARARWFALLLLLPACRGTSGRAPAPGASQVVASASAAPTPAPVTVDVQARLDALAVGEQRRDSSVVTPDDLASPEGRIRQAAARALARIADTRAAELELRALGDPDLGVVRWAAYGVGYGCAGRQGPATRALAARAASVASTPVSPARDLALDAIADGLARCGGDEAERTLSGWLDLAPTLAESAALALGRLATRQRRLGDTTLVALLDAASRSEAPVPGALLAFTRLPAQGKNIEARLAEVARGRLGSTGLSRTLAIRALGRAGAEAWPALAEVLAGPATAAEKGDAARALAAAGPRARAVLARGLAPLVPPALDEASLVTPMFPVLVAVLDALEPPAREAKEALLRLAGAPVPEGASARLTRRLVTLRCAAAGVLAGANPLDRALVACDPDPKGRALRLAQVRAMGRAAITGAAGRKLRELLEVDDAVVRSAAIELFADHPEIALAPRLLAAALDSKADGTVAAVATVIAAHPDRAAKPSKTALPPVQPLGTSAAPAAAAAVPEPVVVAALTRALAKERAPDAVETTTALIDAAAALDLLSAKPTLERLCKSPWPALRSHAESALHRLGDRERRCPSQPGDAAAERASKPELTVRLETDAGTLGLVLDATLAPSAVGRIEALVRAGFYDGMAVHRVVPGFVAQLGDPGGDGYGGAGRAPLRCETSPEPFEALRVGVALAGRDTGSSQFFVTLGPAPHLDGDYAWLGRATGPWDALTVGDVVTRASIVD